MRKNTSTRALCPEARSRALDSRRELTFPTLLAGFVTVTDREIAEAVRMLIRTTHNLAEGAGAAGLAGLFAIRERLEGKSVAVILSGF